MRTRRADKLNKAMAARRDPAVSRTGKRSHQAGVTLRECHLLDRRNFKQFDEVVAATECAMLSARFNAPSLAQK